jgi:hypothetical protein
MSKIRTPVRAPNKRTRRALKKIRSRKHVETFESVSKWARKARAL